MKLRISIPRIRLDPSLFVLAALIALLGAVREWAIVLTCLLGHELAHAAAAAGFGLRVEELRVTALGAAVQIESGMELKPEVEAAVAMAGPMASLVMAAAGLMWGRSGDLFTGVNIALAAFNLLPAFPLDGGRVFRALAACNMGWRRATRLAVALSRVLAAGIVVAGAVGLAFGQLNPLPLALGVFVWIEAGKEGRWAALAPARQALRARAELGRGRILPSQAVAATVGANAVQVLSSLGASGVTMVWVLSPEGAEVGRLSQMQLVDGVSELGSEATLAQLLSLRCYERNDKQETTIRRGSAQCNVPPALHRE